MYSVTFRRIIFSIIILICFNYSAYGQKNKVDSSDLYTWPSLDEPKISPDGNYAMYSVRNEYSGTDTLIVKSLVSVWEQKVVCSNLIYYGIKLTNKQAFFINGNDSLGIINLGGSIVYYPEITSFDFSNNESTDWILTLGKNNLQLLKDNKHIKFKNVLSSRFVLEGNSILIQSYDSIGKDCIQKIKLVDLRNMHESEIWRGVKAESITLDLNGNKCAFITSDPLKGNVSNGVVICDLVNNKSDTIVNDLYSHLWISDLKYFSKSGHYLLLNLSEFNDPIKKSNDAKVKVWSYNDEKIQSQQIQDLKPKSYVSTINLRTKQLIRLLQEREDWVVPISPMQENDLSLIFQTRGDCSSNERRWNSTCNKTFFLVDLNDGHRKEIKTFYGNNIQYNYTISPGGKYILFYDNEAKSYFSYSIRDSSLRDLTKGIFKVEDSILISNAYISKSFRGIAGWCKDDKSMLIYDTHDIWVFDPVGIIAPYNLTNGYGRKHNIMFSLLGGRENRGGKDNYIENKQDDIILTALNLSNKNNGFYKSSMRDGAKDPTYLTMGPFIYYLPFGGIFDYQGMKPIQATHSKKFIIRRESCRDFPNYFTTNDFQSFKPLSNIYPEKKYKWLTSELHSWKLPDGRMVQGILYKPQDFDSTKKYPIIFNIYERMSNSLNAYINLAPLCSGCTVNPPLAVNNGYLMFLPDIYFKLDETGESALETVSSAANHLSNYSWIDTARMGLQGCSFGGFETNYIASHSKIFKAICTASGISDLISHSSDYSEGVYTSGALGQLRIKTMIWDDASVIINNSPIFKVKDIVTPILLFHTTNDVGIKFSQALELYLILRRLNKKVWLLEYGDANHGVFEPKQSKDFSLRMFQFFDYYLKDALAPKWMKDGIKAKNALTEDGLEYTEGRIK